MDEREHLLRERLALIEAELQFHAQERAQQQAELDRRLGAAKELLEEKLAGVRGQQDSALEASDRRFESIRLQGEKRDEVITTRISAQDERLSKLERGESASEGQRRGVTELKTSTLAWIGAAATFTYVLIALIVNHVL